jgi:type IV pilus assembly protein PilQ
MGKMRDPWHTLTALLLLGMLLLGGGCNGMTVDTWKGLTAKSDKPPVELPRIVQVVHIRTQQGERVSLTATKPLTYQVFRLVNPERVVLLFSKTILGPAVQPIVINDSPLTGLFPSEVKGGDSRLEVTLLESLEYEVKERADGLDIFFSNSKNRLTGPKATIRDLTVFHQKNSTELRLLGHGRVAASKTFRLNNPPRLVVDMAGVAGPTQGRRFPINSAYALNALLVGGPGKSRLVVELTDPNVGFLVKEEAGLPVILLGHQIHSTKDVPGIKKAALFGIHDIKFTREGASSLVQIFLNNKGGPLKTRREDRQIFLSLANTPVAPALIRRMDVRAFGGPVLAIDTALKEGGAQVVVNLEKVGSRHEVLEKNGEILVRIHPTSQKSVEGDSPFTGKKISLDFKEIDIQNALRIIAEVSDLNIILSDSVEGTLTMRLVDVPWDQALELILEAKGLGRVKQGNVLRIAPLAEIQTTAQARLKARQSARQLEPFITELIPVSFADSVELRKLLMEGDQQNNTRLVSASGSVSLDKRTNTLIVKDTAENVAKIKDMVEKLDKPIPQVLIEARIIEVDRNSKNEFGISWGFAYKKLDGGLGVSSNVANAYETHLAGSIPENPRARMTTNSPSNVSLLPLSAPTGSIGFHLGGLSPLLDLDIEIAALENDNKAKTISSPRVLTTNNKTAQISQGVKQPYTVLDDGTMTTSFIEATLSLKVTPQVTPNSFITLQIEATNDSIAGTGTPPPINTKTINTQALVRDGETIVLGGIFQNNQVKNTSGVPGLSKIPFLGGLFRNRADSNTQTELLIFITPHIIHPRQ